MSDFIQSFRDKWEAVRHKQVPRPVIVLIGVICTASFVYFAWF